VESGRRDEVTGVVHPWPWTANAEGQGYFYATKADAIAAVSAMQARGIRSVDVGCGQINLMHHPAAFPNLEQAFDPQANAAYAAHFLRELFQQTGDWTKAAAMYHSATPELGAEYQHKVMAAWPEEQRLAGRAGMTPLARAWAATMGSPPPLGFRPVARRLQSDPQGPRIMLSALGGTTFPAARQAP
jgi:soluble lytic murein transglycosylase-like protein